MVCEGEKPLRVACVHWGFPPIIGGVENHLVTILPQMVKWGHKVSILTGTTAQTKTKYTYRGVKVWRTPLMDINWLARRGFEGIGPKILKMFEEFFETFQPDVIHCHNLHYFSRMHTKDVERISKEKSIPLVLTAHNIWDNALCLDLTRRVAWSHIIAVSRFIKRELLGVGCDSKKITVVYHGIDTEMFRSHVGTEKIWEKYPFLKNKKIIFHPARIGMAKGCDTSLKAVNIVKKRFPDVILVLSGSKDIVDWSQSQQKDIAYLIDLMETLGLEDNTLIDSFTCEEMIQLYKASSVCIYPSSAMEPFGIAVLEALASERPVIVTNSGGLPEIIKNGVNGLIVPVKDYKALASRILRLLTDIELRRRLTYAGLRMVQTRFTAETVTKATLNVYNKVLENG